MSFGFGLESLLPSIPRRILSDLGSAQRASPHERPEILVYFTEYAVVSIGYEKVGGGRRDLPSRVNVVGLS